MLSFKDSQTKKNILIAFVGESQARNRYSFFSKQAKKEGFEQIAYIFEETANQEKEHAKRLLKLLDGGKIELTTTISADTISSTLDNLNKSADCEYYEQAEMYPNFAKIAYEESLEKIADIFLCIAIAERFHEKRFRNLASNISTNKIFSRINKVTWRCRNCGFLHDGTTTLDQCPACLHPKAYFELLGENY